MRPGYLSELFVSFQGEGAHVGERHLFVRLAGCNIRCTYCDTPDSLERVGQYTVYASDGGQSVHENPILPNDLATLVSHLLESEGPIDAIALTGGEPLTQAEFLREFLVAADLPVPVLLETNGVLPKKLAEVVDLVDIVSMDIKLPSNSSERPFWEEHASFLAQAKHRDLYVKILVDGRTSTTDLHAAGRLLEAEAPDIEAFLQPIVDSAGAPQVSNARLTEFYLLLRQQHRRLRVLPQTHKILGVR